MSDLVTEVNGVIIPAGFTDRLITNNHTTISREDASKWFANLLHGCYHIDFVNPRNIAGGNNEGIVIRVY